MADDRGIPAARLAELRAKYPRSRYVEGDGQEWAVFLIPPATPALKAYKHELHDPTLRPDAQEGIFRKMAVECWTVWDGLCPVDKLLEQYGLAPEGCSDAVSALTGLAAQARGKT